jgi:hypothetical protein
MTVMDQPCEACGAIAGEECNPLCVGVAAQKDYPYGNLLGQTVWACCVSQIGPVCQHRTTPEPGVYISVLA